MKTVREAIVLGVLFVTAACTGPGHADRGRPDVRAIVDAAVAPVMRTNRIPGMAVGVIAGGTERVFDYGVASTQTRRPVTRDTLFEIGSISKTFTATLASYAQVTGRLSLSDGTAAYLPQLAGTKFGSVTLLELGTHTTGGLPLQVPDGVPDTGALVTYLRHWQPAHVPGTYRTYSNVSIGLLGVIAAKSLDRDFVQLMQERLFPALGLRETYIRVPAAQAANYAQGYTQDDTPIRVRDGVLAAQAYGVKTTAGDLLRFLEANLGTIALPAALRGAVLQTHTGYFRVGGMTQDLIWEQYPYPVARDALLKGNGRAIIFGAVKVVRITPPEAPRSDVWINKTGSTNGFGAYVAFVPAKRLGIVILANKTYPIAQRVRLAYEILSRLAGSATY